MRDKSKQRTTEAIGLILLSHKVGELDSVFANRLIADLIEAHSIHEQVDRYRLERDLHPDIDLMPLLDRSESSDRLHQNRFSVL